MTTTRTTDQTNAVATYESLQGAERAVTHLVSLGYDEHDLGIGPRDFEVVEQPSLRCLVGRWLRWGWVVGIATMTGIALVRELDGETIVGSVLPMVAWGAAGGLVIGTILGLVAYRRHRAHSFLTQPDVMAATRFDVVVDRTHDKAGHALATWWDPSARPLAGCDRRETVTAGGRRPSALV